MNEDLIETIVPNEPAAPVTPVETPATPTPSTPPIDIAEITRQVQEQTRADLIEKLGAGKTEAEKQEIKEYLTEIPFLNENRNPKDWKEAVKAIREESVAATLKALEEREQKIKAEQDLSEKQKVETEKSYVSTWNSQFEQLEKDGKIPVMPAEIKTKLDKGEKLTKEEQNNPAVKARNELFNLGIANEQTDIEKVYYKYVEPVLKNGKRVVPGADAPVSAGKGSAQPGSDGSDFSYDEIHGATVHSIIAGK